MNSDRINARLSAPLAKFVARMVGEDGPYETPSEYVRDLIRRDMERRQGGDADVRQLESGIMQGYRDVATGRSFESSGDFKTDMVVFRRKQAEGWK